MNLPLFTDSDHCRARAHCGTCRRQDATGAEWRRRVPGGWRGDPDAPCPHGVAWGASSAPVTPVDVWSAEGPKMWKELHLRTLLVEINPATERAWLEAFFGRLPCGECRDHARRRAHSHPPDFTSNATYFRWGFDFHNEVNLRLKKPAADFNRARTFWEAHRREFFTERRGE